MKPEIEKLVIEVMDFYDKESLVLGLDISFVTHLSPYFFKKGVFDTAWLISKRDLEFMPVIEGEAVAIHTGFDLSDKTPNIVFAKIRDFLSEKNIPVKLNLFIDIREKKFDACLLQLK